MRNIIYDMLQSHRSVSGVSVEGEGFVSVVAKMFLSEAAAGLISGAGVEKVSIR